MAEEYCRNDGNEVVPQDIDSHKDSFKITTGVFLYIVLCTIVLLTAYFQYFINLSYLIANISTILLMVIICGCLIGKKKITLIHSEISKMDLLAILFGFFLLMLRLAFGDSVSWDTLNYHIYAQQSLGENFVTKSFFPGRAINSMCWILGDQIHYFFRFYLGYRLGTIGTFFVFILLYFQVKNLVNKFLKSLSVNCNEIYIAAIALACIIVDNVLWSLNLYYVDVFSLPLLLAIIDIVIFAEEQSEWDILYVAYLAGLIASLKLSNAYMLLALGVIYIFRFRNEIHVKTLLLAVLVALFPLGVYCVWSMQLTGNPIFPYANSIFKSQYFTTEQSVNDIAGFPARFGPENVWQFIFWPFYCMFNKARIVDGGRAYSGRLLCAFLGMILYFVSKIWIKYSKQVKLCVGIVLFFYIEYLTVYEGYIRYMIILEILSAVIIGVVIVTVVQVKRQGCKILGMLVVAAFTLQISVCLNDYVFEKNEIALRSTFFTDFEGYLSNLKYVFKDRKVGIDETVLNDVDVWLSTAYDSAYATIIDGVKPIINIIPDATITNEESEEVYNQLIEELTDKNVYVVGNINSIDKQISNLNNAGFVVQSEQNINPYFYNAECGMILLKTCLSSENKTVSILGLNGEIVYTIPTNSKKGSISVGCDATTRNNKDNTSVIEVWVKNLNSQGEYCIEKFEMDYYDQYKTISYDIPDEEWNEITSIVVDCYDKNGEPKAVRAFINEPK